MFLIIRFEKLCVLTPLVYGTKMHFEWAVESQAYCCFWPSNMCDKEMELSFWLWKFVEMLIIKNKRNRWVHSINKQQNLYGSYFWSELKSDTICFVIMTSWVRKTSFVWICQWKSCQKYNCRRRGDQCLLLANAQTMQARRNVLHRPQASDTYFAPSVCGFPCKCMNGLFHTNHFDSKHLLHQNAS